MRAGPAPSCTQVCKSWGCWTMTRWRLSPWPRKRKPRRPELWGRTELARSSCPARSRPAAALREAALLARSRAGGRVWTWRTCCAPSDAGSRCVSRPPRGTHHPAGWLSGENGPSAPGGDRPLRRALAGRGVSARSARSPAPSPRRRRLQLRRDDSGSGGSGGRAHRGPSAQTCGGWAPTISAERRSTRFWGKRSSSFVLSCSTGDASLLEAGGRVKGNATCRCSASAGRTPTAPLSPLPPSLSTYTSTHSTVAAHPRWRGWSSEQVEMWPEPDDLAVGRSVASHGAPGSLDDSTAA